MKIWGRLLDARGTPLGGQLRISAMGPDGDPGFQATEPAVAYNARTNEYLVAWQGWDLGQTPGAEEVFVQRLSATGAEVGADDARISVTGPEGNLDFDAQDPAVTANGASGEYLVAWRGDVAEGEDEVFAQRLDPAASQVGADDLRLSDMGPEGDTRFDAGAPAVARYNGRTGEYLGRVARRRGGRRRRRDPRPAPRRRRHRDRRERPAHLRDGGRLRPGRRPRGGRQ